MVRRAVPCHSCAGVPLVCVKGQLACISILEEKGPEARRFRQLREPEVGRTDGPIPAPKRDRDIDLGGRKNVRIFSGAGYWKHSWKDREQ